MQHDRLMRIILIMRIAGVNVPNVEEEMERYQEIVRAQIARQTIEVNLSMQDTNKIYNLAEQFQKPVSNLGQEIIHRYLGC